MKVLRPIAAIVTLLALVGCVNEDNPLLEDVAKQYGISYCMKLSQCMGEKSFDEVYPDGYEECASRTYKIYGTDERSVCSQEQWDECSKDMESGGKDTCIKTDAGVLRPKIPESCHGC